MHDGIHDLCHSLLPPPLHFPGLGHATGFGQWDISKLGVKRGLSSWNACFGDTRSQNPATMLWEAQINHTEENRSPHWESQPSSPPTASINSLAILAEWTILEEDPPAPVEPLCMSHGSQCDMDQWWADSAKSCPNCRIMKIIKCHFKSLFWNSLLCSFRKPKQEFEHSTQQSELCFSSLISTFLKYQEEERLPLPLHWEFEKAGSCPAVPNKAIFWSQPQKHHLFSSF